MMMIDNDDDDDDGLAPPWANRERLPADLCLPIKLHSALNVVTIQRSRLWCKYSIQYRKYSVESRITRCFESLSGFIKSYSCDSEWDSYVWKWISGSRPITWTRIHFSTWWTTFFLFFFYLFTIQTDAVAVLSSLHSSQTTHIWWSVSELRCWFFWIFFFCSFSFSKLLKYYRNLCDKNSLRQEKYKKKKKESEGSATFFSLQPSLCLTSF